jgi:hypothetical protein
MDLSLSFREGVVSGSGADPVGRFGIRGRYDAGNGEVWWTKTYAGAHDVFYRGFRDARGLWGTWEIHPGWKGGFHLWPRGEGTGEEARAEEEVPVEAASRPPGEGKAPFHLDLPGPPDRIEPVNTAARYSKWYWSR